MTPSPGALLCGLVPFAALCFSVPLWDRVYPMLFGLPFNLVWLLSWILLTPLFLWAAYHIEERRPQRGRPE
jgi:hypothetical protein